MTATIAALTGWTVIVFFIGYGIGRWRVGRND